MGRDKVTIAKRHIINYNRYISLVPDNINTGTLKAF